MTTYVWKQFPEINRKIAFCANYTTMAGGLGCHCGTMSSISASTLGMYGTGPSIQAVQPIDPKKDQVGTVKITAGGYNGYYVLTPEEVDKINKHFKEKNVTFDSFSDELCAALVSNVENVPIWVLSDVINYKSPARNSGVVSKEKPPEPEVFMVNSGVIGPKTLLGRTCQFADYIIKNKVGYILESPIIQNPNHRSWGSYSLNRVWLWIPPKNLNRAVGLTAQYGQDKFPSIEDWKKTVFKDLKESAKAMGQYVCGKMDADITEDSVFKVVFDGGVFPDEKRFAAKEA